LADNLFVGEQLSLVFDDCQDLDNNDAYGSNYCKNFILRSIAIGTKVHVELSDKDIHEYLLRKGVL